MTKHLYYVIVKSQQEVTKMCNKKQKNILDATNQVKFWFWFSKKHWKKLEKENSIGKPIEANYCLLEDGSIQPYTQKTVPGNKLEKPEYDDYKFLGLGVWHSSIPIEIYK